MNFASMRSMINYSVVWCLRRQVVATCVMLKGVDNTEICLGSRSWLLFWSAAREGESGQSDHPHLVAASNAKPHQ